MLDKIVLIFYGLFLILGGVFGYIKAKSIVSLAMGIGSGLLVFLGLWLITINPRVSWIFLSCLTGFLAVTFLMRFIKTQAFMPSGMLFVITLAVLIFCLTRLK